MLVKFIYKNDYHKKIHYISEDKFDESTMIKQEDDTKEQKEKQARLKEVQKVMKIKKWLNSSKIK